MGWHTYQVEVKGSEMIYRLDGRLIEDVAVGLGAGPAKIGIYVDHAAIEVRSIKVFAVS